MRLFFKDNFFSAGYTDIMNETGEVEGNIDLKSAFGSSLNVMDVHGAVLYSGSFRTFSRKWEVLNGDGEEVGVLCVRMSFFSKKFEYEAYERGIYEITAPAFSQEYEIMDDYGNTLASFSRISGWLRSGAYCLDNSSPELDIFELIVVVMGINAIQKEQRSSH
ncbi:hypothetical protein Q5741_20895 [Paenibacillus sp. JX-17]|uniref:Uncharacterized protein n=1 Tax=Paenibacillus lacisoli TaxID=3064525 RepID=A0ABT9CMH3_9BACL|nr:hypothetical protein [Paenibacillus sp. JX-17]MDO7908846.1 hypothetical protein [Paenibacillus sp. JX-17]